MIINRNGDKIYRDPITGKEYLLMLCTTLDRKLHYDICTIFETSEDEPIGEYVNHFFGITFCDGDDALDREVSGIVCKGFTPTAFYTGGGIWLSAVYMDATHYAVVDSETDSCLSIYDHSDEDQDDLYPCQNMTECKAFCDLSGEEITTYDILLRKLREAMR